jgi:hypothetical protein
VSDQPPLQYELSGKRSPVRHIADPDPSVCFRSVTRIWHFPDGAVFLELADRRDCLLSNIDRVDVQAAETHDVSGALVLDTQTTVQVTDEQDTRTISEVDHRLVL